MPADRSAEHRPASPPYRRRYRALTVTQFGALSATAVGGADHHQVQALTITQIDALTTSQVIGFTASAGQSLHLTEVAALTSTDIGALTTSQAKPSPSPTSRR